jgi:hypothetical protein
MTLGNLLLLVAGLFLAWIVSRDLIAAWRNKCFRKGPAQLWDVPLESAPVVYWVLIIGNLSLIALGIVVALIGASDVWEAFVRS